MTVLPPIAKLICDRRFPFVIPGAIYLFWFCLVLAPVSTAAQSSNFELHEIPPYLDPPTNSQIGVRDIQINSQNLPPSGPDHPDLLHFDLSFGFLSKAGYKPPPLTPKIKYAGMSSSRYAVFRFDFKTNPNKSEWDDDDLGIYISGSDCKIGSSSTPVSKYNYRNWIALNTNIKDKADHNLRHTYSHELFHAFQDGYPLFEYDCVISVGAPPGWITEATADAAANILTEHAFPSAWKNRSDAGSLAMRSYRIAFQDRLDWLVDPYFKSDVAPIWTDYAKKTSRTDKIMEAGAASDLIEYYTSSFWQFLARRSTGIRADKANPTEVAKLLSTWIPLLQTQPDTSVSISKGWLKLVDDYVEVKLPLNDKPSDHNEDGSALYAWFPEFLTEYASWWEERYPQLAKSESTWHEYAFGKCETITLKPSRSSSGSTQKVTLNNFRKNSGRCINVELSGFTGPVTIKVHADAKNTVRADQLHLGLARIEAPLKKGKKVRSCWDNWDSDRIMCLLPGKVESDPPGKTWKAEQFSAQTLNLGKGPVSARLTYVLSNVAMYMEDTRTIENLNLTFSAFYNFGGDKTFAPPNSIRPQNPTQLSQIMTGDNKKQIFYRLYTSPPIGVGGMFPIELNEIESGEQPRCGGDSKYTYCAYDTGGDYYIRPGPNVSFGQIGRIFAAVHKNAVNGPMLMSTYCSPDADQKAVEILDSSEDGVVIRVNTDLCDVPEPDNNYCGRKPTCPVRDHLLTTMTLGLGREHFAETAPIHQLTPGTRFDMDLYFRYGVPTESFSSSSDPGGNSGDASESGPTTGSGTGESSPAVPGGSSNDGVLDNCVCTCEEREDALRQAEDLKARSEAGEEISGTAFMALMNCASECQTEYMICVMEENNEKEAAEEAQRQSTSSNQCDCSCTAINELESNMKTLMEEFNTRDQSALVRLEELGQCMNVCAGQIAECMGK